MANHTSITIWIERAMVSSMLRAEVRCTVCQKPLLPPDGVYLLRLTLEPEPSRVHGTLRGPDGTRWAFRSGSELAELFGFLGHAHLDDVDDVEAMGAVDAAEDLEDLDGQDGPEAPEDRHARGPSEPPR